MKNQSTYIAFLCHIVSIQVDKQACLDIFKPDKSCIYPLTLNSACLMKSTMKRSGFWVSNIEISRTPPKASFQNDQLGRIQAYLFIFMLQTCLNLGQTQDLTKIQMGINIQKNQKIKNQSQHIQSSYVIYIVRIEVDKQGLDIFKLDKSCIYPLKP